MRHAPEKHHDKAQDDDEADDQEDDVERLDRLRQLAVLVGDVKGTVNYSSAGLSSLSTAGTSRLSSPLPGHLTVPPQS